ncbi:PAS domain S-box protein [Natronolimnohabitans sp. A-GB9]|uniref:PAS domain S-box protein n=1 Tax=Natronolimnohabitans sp. A-GB9 TaxID=3069757 RepID=UPI0027B78882|nr:PAS domain S-box protein [Natronolimnohabitans sp. A-GB9]MDQ2051467.1 PAS domain S-box protein [Natronolimnohabitans sp. A-GB9]
MDPSSHGIDTDGERRLRQQQLVADLGDRALEGADLEELFRDAMEAVRTALETESCAILELQPGSGEFVLRDGIGWGSDHVGTETIPAGNESQAGYALQATDPVVVDDLRSDDRIAGSEPFLECDLVSGISAVIGSDDDPWGVLGTYATTQQEFDDGDVIFVRNVANVLASAIERDRVERRRSAEATLKDKIVETSPIGITIVGIDGEMRFANDRAEEIFGRPRERINELSFDDPAWDEIGPDGEPLEREELPFPRIVESEEPLFDQLSGVLRPDGERVWISVNGAPLYDDRGEIDGVVFAIEDVTDQFHRNHELERYETIVETAHDGIYVLDDERRFELVNDSFAELTSYDRQELRGRHASAVFGEEFAAIGAEKRAAIDGPKSPAFEETITAGLDETRTVENRFHIMTGDEKGEKRVGVVRDITERERLEAELRAERELKDRILETSPVGITLLDADGMNVFANDRAQELFGRSLEELQTYVHDDDRWDLVGEDGEALSGDDLPFTSVKETGEPVYDDVIGIEQPDGTRVWLSAHCAPLFDADGEFDGAVYALRNITERKRLENELEQTLDRVSDAFHAVDTEWNFTYVNTQAKELLDAEDRDLIGNSIWEAFPSAVGSRFEEEYRRAMETQESVTFEAYSPAIDGWVEVNAYPSETGLSMYFRDVTERREMEARLRERERQFRTLAEHVEEIVWLTDEDPSEFIYVNPAYEDVYGHSRESLYEDGLSWLEFVHPDDRERVRQAFTELPDTTFDEEFRIVTADGETRWIHAQAVSAPGEEGELARIVGISSDVTERREREQYFRDAKARLEAATEAGAVGTWEWHVPEDSLVTGPTFARTFGIDPADTQEGVSIERLLDSIHAVDRNRVRNAIEDAVERCGEYEAEYRVHDADGEIRWVIARGHVECDANGDPETFPGALTDITERKRAELEAERQRRQLETLFDVLPVGVVVANADGSILRANDTAREIWDGDVFETDSVVGYEKCDATWADSGDPVAPKEWTIARVLEGEVISEPNVYEIEAFDGRQRIIAEYGMPVRDGRGNVSRGVVVLTDITERKEYQRKLEESNERLEQFAYAASHDLQEPLRMVSSYLSLIDTRYGEELDEDGQEFLEFAVDGAERMREMIDGLLEFSRVETRGEPLEPVDLDDVLADVRQDLAVRIEEQDAEIDAEPLPHVEGDDDQLRRVFQNLLSNAIEYSGDDPPQVDISAREKGDRWEIAVEDDGIGIDPDDADRVFGLFERLHAADEHAGSGIGLALCERIVERHGGEIRVDSEPGDGSTFSFTLPAANAEHDS